jgi:hypothetical protein
VPALVEHPGLEFPGESDIELEDSDEDEAGDDLGAERELLQRAREAAGI